MVIEDSQKLAKAFKAVSNPARLNILEMLQSESRTGKELAELLEIGPPEISRHVHALQEVGLVSLTREGKSVRCRLVQASTLEKMTVFIHLLGGFQDRRRRGRKKVA